MVEAARHKWFRRRDFGNLACFLLNYDILDKTMLDREDKRVVYLIGAGGTHGSIKATGSPRGMLMRDLNPLFADEVHNLLERKRSFVPLQDVVNRLVLDDADIEHLITFFDESPSVLHRNFAAELRRIFERVLRRELALVKKEQGEARIGLFSALLDMHEVQGIGEKLTGILTLNYDDYIEAAAKTVYGNTVDFGLGPVEGSGDSVSLLKLHGSFQWQGVWPIRASKARPYRSAWIPPGIRKVKDHYPFNLVWGRARDLLDCDVLRVVGCRLGGNDWDLISLLFSTRYSNANRIEPYLVEIIDSPSHAERLKGQYPYLDLRSMLEIDTFDVGVHVLSEMTGNGALRRFQDIDRKEAKAVLDACDSEEGRKENWFRLWLLHMVEGIERELGPDATQTRSGVLDKTLGR